MHVCIDIYMNIISFFCHGDQEQDYEINFKLNFYAMIGEKSAISFFQGNKRYPIIWGI